MDVVLHVVSAVVLLGMGIALFWSALPSKRDDHVPRLPPLHWGYKPRKGPIKTARTDYPKPPPGKGGGS